MFNTMNAKNPIPKPVIVNVQSISEMDKFLKNFLGKRGVVVDRMTNQILGIRMILVLSIATWKLE